MRVVQYVWVSILPFLYTNKTKTFFRMIDIFMIFLNSILVYYIFEVEHTNFRMYTDQFL